jgi:hypothetical protein
VGFGLVRIMRLCGAWSGQVMQGQEGCGLDFVVWKGYLGCGKAGCGMDFTACSGSVGLGAVAHGKVG